MSSPRFCWIPFRCMLRIGSACAEEASRPRPLHAETSCFCFFFLYRVLRTLTSLRSQSGLSTLVALQCRCDVSGVARRRCRPGLRIIRLRGGERKREEASPLQRSQRSQRSQSPWTSQSRFSGWESTARSNLCGWLQLGERKVRDEEERGVEGPSGQIYAQPGACSLLDYYSCDFVLIYS